MKNIIIVYLLTIQLLFSQDCKDLDKQIVKTQKQISFENPQPLIELFKKLQDCKVDQKDDKTINQLLKSFPNLLKKVSITPIKNQASLIITKHNILFSEKLQFVCENVLQGNNQECNTKLVQFIKFLKENNEINKGSTLKNYFYHEVNENQVLKFDKQQLKIYFINIFNDKKKSKTKLKLKIVQDQETIQNINVDSDTISLKLKKPGFYFVQDENNDINTEFKVVTKIKSHEIRFQAVQGEKVPKKYKKVKDNEIKEFKEQIDQNSFIFAIVKVQQNQNINPLQFVGLRLHNQQQNKSSQVVIGEYDQEKGYYRVTIDLGNPNHILPISGKYTCDVIISDDRISDSINQPFATFDISFNKDIKEAKDSSKVQILPDLNHTFKPEKSQVSIQFILFICSLAVIIFVKYIQTLKKQNLNFNLMNNAPISSFLFTFGLILLAISLVGYWVYLNIFQMFFIVPTVSILIFLSGNYAITHINKNIGSK